MSTPFDFTFDIADLMRLSIISDAGQGVDGSVVAP